MDRESILDLSKYLNSIIHVELSGGRKGIMFTLINSDLLLLVKGVLKGFDQLNNLVLEQAIEENGNYLFLFLCCS